MKEIIAKTRMISSKMIFQIHALPAKKKIYFYGGFILQHVPSQARLLPFHFLHQPP